MICHALSSLVSSRGLVLGDIKTYLSVLVANNLSQYTGI